MPIPLLDRCSPDSIREFRAAAGQRFAEGCLLADDDHRLAAIYLWGYTGEMLLKAAFFAAYGYDDSQEITTADLHAARQLARDLGVTGFDNLHSITGWGQLLVRTRMTVPALRYSTVTFPGEVIGNSQRLYQVWRETLRYLKNVAYPFGVRLARTAAGWLLARAGDL